MKYGAFLLFYDGTYFTIVLLSERVKRFDSVLVFKIAVCLYLIIVTYIIKCYNKRLVRSGTVNFITSDILQKVYSRF